MDGQAESRGETEGPTLRGIKEGLVRFLTRHPGKGAPPDQRPVTPIAPLINPESKTPLQDIRDRSKKASK